MSNYNTNERTPITAAFGVVGSALSGALEARKLEDLPALRKRMETLNLAMNALEAVAAPQRPFGRGPAEMGRESLVGRMRRLGTAEKY